MYILNEEHILIKERKKSIQKRNVSKKYKENSDFRNEKLLKGSMKYKEDDEYRISLKESNKKRYQNNPAYQCKSMKRSRAQYNDHREQVHENEKLKKVQVR